MATKLSIIRNAVLRGGGERIQSLNDDSDDVIAAVTLYDSVATECLCAHAWTFATKEEAISKTSNTPKLPYKSAFALPAECINIRDVRDQYGAPVEYEVVDNAILTRREYDDTLTLTFNWWPAETRWPADFAAAVEEMMVARVLEAFEERIRALEREEIARGKLDRAMRRDRRQSPPKRINRGPLLRAWRGRNVGRT